MTKTRRLLTAFVAAGSLTLAGCATIPSITPFSEQTTRMVSGVNAGYTASQLSLEGVSPERAKELADAWAPTAAALNGVVAYSQALSSLAEQGAKGEEAADALADALTGLTATLNIAALPAGVTSAVAAINGHIAVVRARRSLHEAVAAAQPATAEIAKILTQQLTALGRLHDLASVNALGNLRTSHQAMVDYVEAERRAETKVLLILRRILDYQERGPRAQDEDFDPIKELDGDAKRDNVEAREAHWIAVVRKHQEHLAPYSAQYTDYLERQGDISAARKTGAMTFRRAQAAVTQWSGAHAKLRATLDEKKPLELSAFFSAVRDVYEAYLEGQAATATQ